MNNKERFITREEIDERVPSIYRGRVDESRSSKYVFTPTFEIIDSFEQAGWHPTKVSGVKPSKRDVHTVKHLIRFGYEDNKIINDSNGLAPEVIIVNSHNGHCPLSCHLGFFRFACANGLIVGTSISELRWTHKKLDYGEVKNLIISATDEFIKLEKNIPNYMSINLNKKQQIDFAEKTIQMVWNSDRFEPEKLLEPRRVEDSADDLFSVFNRIQENIIKGGIKFDIPEDRIIRNKLQVTREIKNIDKEVNVNITLWAMMHNFYENGRF